MSLAVVFLPDTALLVPGAAGRADPAAGLRDAAVAALADLAGADARGGRVLVVAPARGDRFLPHPVAPGLGAAGLLLPDVAPAVGSAPAAGAGSAPAAVPGAEPGAAIADVPASAALVLLRAARVTAPVDVLEIARPAAAPATDAPPSGPDLDPAAGAHAVPVADAPPTGPTDPGPAAVAHAAPGDLRALVVVGSLSARHGPDAPLADDPRAPDADAALLAALAEGPAALARALDDLGPAAARDLAVSGWAPWRAALALLPAGTPDVTATTDVTATPGAAATPRTPHAEVVAGAQHAVVAWRVTGPDDTDVHPHAPHHPEEPR
ncbi:hypothetical protein [Cellulomonas pakistanensis]|uniref:Uncharacterized protein n=1 Tax=Cellulomonas pakistanensis TaxID=992287 RepID=A0A919U7P9_9CELL|nr:hypothetical protein [Cellulomonas pakistanensis]GIG37212.1 hypothetical protein Cpa01nite_25930 [Cellulomonas pakistanensis]